MILTKRLIIKNSNICDVHALSQSPQDFRIGISRRVNLKQNFMLTLDNHIKVCFSNKKCIAQIKTHMTQIENKVFRIEN